MATLLETIIDGATTTSTPIPDLLRLCLRLARKLKSETLSTWAESELNGYLAGATVPPYRSIPAAAQGRFQNIAYIQTLLIPPVVLEEEHRHFAEKVVVREPVAQLQFLADSDGKTLQRNWPGNLVLYYQDKIVDNAHMTDAWQVIGPSAFTGIIDTIRTRVLQLALDLADESGLDLEKLANSTPQHTQQIIHNHLYGSGQFVSIGNENQIQNIDQLNQIAVMAGDRAALDKVLRQLGINDEDLAELSRTLPEASKSKRITAKLTGWIKAAATKAGAKLGNAALDATTAAITQLVKQFLGLPPG
ncbi:hypothetical protein [Dongia sp.]|uniref:AbiTii domain-containing protein n=1 Tax=Dongia sp. TaxID=1977262 RepID=UPI0037526A5C